MSIPQQLDHIRQLASSEAAGDGAAHQKLLQAVRTLQLTVERPCETIRRINMQMLQNVVLRVAVEQGWLNLVSRANGSPVHVSKIAEETGSDVEFVIRIVRYLAALGLCNEDGEKMYSANEKTHFFATSGAVASVKTTYGIIAPIAGRLMEYLRGPGSEWVAGHPAPVNIYKFTTGSDNFFAHVDNRPDEKRCFDEYMAAEQRWHPFAWFDVYPVAQRLAANQCNSDQTLIVDMAGGRGQNLILFREAFPHIQGRLVVQDLPSTIQHNPQPPEGIEAMGHDMFDPQPVKGARIYFIRHTMHDWSDEQAVQVFRQLVAAMDPESSTLLIVDHILPDRGARLRDCELDTLMWLAVYGKERTQRQWEELLHKGGLELVNVWRSPRLDDGVLEARVRK